VGIYAFGLDKSWLGKIIDNESIKNIISIEKKYKINIAGEGGEYETITVDGPIFKKKLIIDDYKIRWNRDNGYLNIKNSHLE